MFEHVQKSDEGYIGQEILNAKLPGREENEKTTEKVCGCSTATEEDARDRD